MTASITLRDLLDELDRSNAYTNDLQSGLTPAQIAWRPNAESSAIGWHLGHQAAVAHFMLRNLVAAEPSIDVDIDRLMDSATPERQRGDLPSLKRIVTSAPLWPSGSTSGSERSTEVRSEHPTSSR